MRRPELTTSVHHLEDGIITLSGPALAVSGILAGVDLLTGGHLLQSPGLALAWAICLLLTLDFQVLALGARAHLAYLSSAGSRRKLVEMAATILVAASISYVSIQMQSIVARMSTIGTLSIEQAAAQLGINTVWLVWERSTLVLLLIFLSGWFREMKRSDTGTRLSDGTVEQVLTTLAKLEALGASIATTRVTVEPASDTHPALTETAGTPGETPSDEQALDAQIAGLLAVRADLSSRKVAELLERPHSTVYRCMKRLKQGATQGDTQREGCGTDEETMTEQET